MKVVFFTTLNRRRHRFPLPVVRVTKQEIPQSLSHVHVPFRRNERAQSTHGLSRNIQRDERKPIHSHQEADDSSFERKMNGRSNERQIDSHVHRILRLRKRIADGPSDVSSCLKNNMIISPPPPPPAVDRATRRASLLSGPNE